ncbi:hypothetical protein Poli38472_010268 [Pythium oligandrum]|uniref:Uncharacterized protein n=1 Tax=Pythium oligandrum TaxID=41045 RepID=A0A8K1FF75_PYTOL|nr:hypothetical protein Poli38472_010268 [Pythium oligandrum]|eukprot:TMW58709.1 hypothetical protein Poli38472_010268 [Pythium oligandrum]
METPTSRWVLGAARTSLYQSKGNQRPTSEDDDDDRTSEKAETPRAASEADKDDGSEEEEPQEAPIETERVAAAGYDVVSDLQRRHDQLQEDVEVLVAHLEKQTHEIESERATMQSMQEQFEATRDAMERELQSLRIENEALRRQNAAVTLERDNAHQKAESAAETHEELLLALKSQQHRDDHARTIVKSLIKERDAARKQLDESQTYCRRLEEELVTNRAELQHMRSENATLTTAAHTATTHKNQYEQRVIREQEQLIQSLRADLLQMEFEFKTLSVDKDRLIDKVSKLQRQSDHPTMYDVISLAAHGDGKKDSKNKGKKQLRVVTSTTTSSDFTNLMTLPNMVDDHEDTTPTSSAKPVAMGNRIRSPMGSLVAKTLSSAKKKLFQTPSTQQTVILPQ